jgi:hypothetical protein
MHDTIVRRHALLARTAVAGLALGALLGSSFVVGSGRALAERDVGVATKPLLDATHVPPLLTTPSEEVVLRYDVHCASASEGAEDAASVTGGCTPGGTVFVRAGMSGPFQPIPLAIDPSATEGRWFARVPDTIAVSRRGFSYYAVLRAGSGDVTTALPPGGASSPHRSLPLGHAVEVSLGRHEFGRPREADQRVAQGRWGRGAGEIGLEGGTNVTPTGGSSFDVHADGAVSVLDQVNRRVLRWAPAASAPAAVPVAVDGTIADLSVGADWTMYVLESARAGRGPVVRAFDRSGIALGVDELPERTATQVRVGSSGPVVLQQPSGQWLPVALGNSATSASSQAVGAPGRPFPGGSEVIVLRTGDEVRLALVNGDVVRRAWRVTSATPLAEVQLAEPLGQGLLVVVRVYTDAEDEFRALVLGPRGLVRGVSLDSADWAESAPLSRFRLLDSSLYQLGSTQEGLFVDRFDLEVK